ncbi:cobalt ECF transporter T component CbiQ [Methanoregula sp.]|jgi:cobalt/nickel transport system permease protein|uniref:cobalt ECF transporter T component CbiQ n=1 Tax=Methanoregula sp. TaxID=2052170 RepID=UPI0025D1A85C|nr:cobalt ECF transporter T component CbiQ [Methanoregula sp.]
MFETLLDNIAQNSTFRHIHPGTKILLGLGSLLICLVSPTPVVPLISGIILSLVLLIPARISPLVYGELLIAPAIFTACSIIVLLFMLGGGDVIWRFSPVSWINLTITDNAVRHAILILFRVFGCTISLFFIALTTPMTDLFNIMKRCRIPVELIDLMMIMYRYIFITYEQAREIWQAQIMRLGYSRVKESIRSFSMLCGMLFISSWIAGEGLIHAMDCRCYDGIMPSLDPAEPVQMQSLFPALLYLAGLIAVLLMITTGVVVIP